MLMPDGRTQRIVAGLGVAALAALASWAVILVLTRSGPPDLAFQSAKQHPAKQATPTTPDVIRSGRLWSGDFEQGDLTQWSVTAAPPDRVRPVQNPVRAGKWAASFEIRPGDGVGHRQQSQLTYSSGETEGVESWWGWSTYFPRNFDAGRWTAFAQWQDSPGDISESNVLFEVKQGSLLLLVRGGVRPATPLVWYLGPLERDHWYDFVFHVRWSSGDAGFVELWENGKPVARKTSTPTLYAGNAFNYLSVGNERSGDATASIFYIDEVKRGTTRKDVES